MAWPTQRRVIPYRRQRCSLGTYIRRGGLHIDGGSSFSHVQRATDHPLTSNVARHGSDQRAMVRSLLGLRIARSIVASHRLRHYQKTLLPSQVQDVGLGRARRSKRERAMHFMFRFALGTAAALILPLSQSAAFAQDWSPSFKSDEPAAVEVKRKPKAIKRLNSIRPRIQQASLRERTKPTRSVHKLAIQVAENNPQLMNLALNNARNVVEYYKSKGEEVAIEIVTFGPGLHMLRDDTSPVKQRILAMALETPDVTFIACANTQANMSKQENKPVTLISEAKVMPSGVVRLMELKGQGYAYLRP